MFADRQTDRHTDKHGHHNTPLPYARGVVMIIFTSGLTEELAYLSTGESIVAARLRKPVAVISLPGTSSTTSSP